MLVKKRIGLLSAVLVLALGWTVQAAEKDAAPVARLTLDACLKSGLAYSQDLQIATKNVKVAEQNVRQAKSALGLTVGYGVNRVESDSASYNSGSVSLDLPLFNYNKLSKNLKVANLQLESAREDERQAKYTAIYNIKSAFYDLWLKEQKLAVAQASSDNLGQHYQTVKKYCEVGKKAEYELLEAEVAWKEQKAAVTSARSNVALAKLALATLIGFDRDRDLQITYDTTVQQMPDQFATDLKTLLAQAEKQRPDFRQAGLDIEMAQLNVGISKANNNPSLSLTGSQNDLTNEFQLTLGVNGTLYDNKATSAKVKAAKEQVAIAQVEAAKTRDTMRQSVQKVYQTIQVDLENAQAYKANINLSKEDLRLTEIRYSAGMSTIMDVKDRQLALDKAKNNFYQTVASYLTDLAQLDLELGQ